jgi:hypothetical protein
MTEGKWVVYRMLGGELDFVQERKWDDYVADRRGRLTATEVSRGHTLTEASRLVKLANEEPT